MATPYRVVVYINGVRVDPMTVTVTASRNSFASFTVDVPAVPEWSLLQPRSHGVVFIIDPVTYKWRMFCEGELMASSGAKDQAGARTRTLSFRGLHGPLDTNDYVNTGTALVSGTIEDSLKVLSNGRLISPVCSGTQESQLSLKSMMTRFATPSTLASKFFPKFIEYSMLQLPVEAFYYYARKLGRKSFALVDKQTEKVVDASMFQDLVQQGISDNSLTANTPLSTIVTQLEGIVYYQHIPVLAPPLMNLTPSYSVIPELMHTPKIYTVVPPACNVIFADQVTGFQKTEDYASQPTRVILQNRLGDQSTVNFTVATSPDVAYNVGNQLDTFKGQVGVFVTHGMLSRDELTRGVITRYRSYDLAKTVSTVPANEPSGTADQTAISLDDYMSHAARATFVEESGLARPAAVNCTFLPFLVPGLPTLIEDYSGPFHAFIESVTHVLPCASPPQTMVTLSFVKPAQLVDGKGDRPPLPAWLNSYYLPSGMMGNNESGRPTWELLFGTSLYQRDGEYLSAAVSKKDLEAVRVTSSLSSFNSSQSFDAAETFDRDKLASRVMPIPTYSANYESLEPSSATIADDLRNSADPRQAMLQYNYRAGVTLTQYLRFHGLLDDSAPSSLDEGLSDPPEFLFKYSGVGKPKAKAIFASPHALEFQCPQGTAGTVLTEDVDVDSGAATLGIYNLVSYKGERLDPAKQQVMLTIASAIRRRVTRS